MATIPTGKFVWFEYVSKDPAKAQAFFGELFNWKTQNVPMPQGSYTMIAHDGQTIGGYTPTPEGTPPHPFWLTHLQVTSAQDSAAKVKAHGGKVMKEPFKVGDHGTMAVVLDPFGGPFALWQPNKIEGTGDFKGQPGHFVWNELYTENPEKSVAFYQAIGGFEHEAMDMGAMGTYHLLKTNGEARAGVTKAPMPGVPQTWMPYVQVANADQAADKAKRLGASLMMPVSEAEGVGRFAIFTDPTGATLGILQPAPR
jgi:predicted enzyme related to lactoylglutathione lyase